MIKNTPKKIVHTFSKDNRISHPLNNVNEYDIYVELTEINNELMYILLKETNGEPVEAPHIDDTEQMELWLDGTNLTLDELLEKVSDYHIWD